MSDTIGSIQQAFKLVVATEDRETEPLPDGTKTTEDEVAGCVDVESMDHRRIYQNIPYEVGFDELNEN